MPAASFRARCIPRNAQLLIRRAGILLKSDFIYQLPAELIAQKPLVERASSRMLSLDGTTGLVEDRRFADLPAMLRRGDLLVFNNTRVIPARLFGEKDSGGRIELLAQELYQRLAAMGIFVSLRCLRESRQGGLDEVGAARRQVGGEPVNPRLPVGGAGDALAHKE